VRQFLDVQLQQERLDKDKSLVNDELQAFDDKTGNSLWKKHFSKDTPLVSQQEPGVLVLFWGMEGETAWDQTLHSSIVTKTADENKEEHQGVLTELVDSQTGAVMRQIMSPEGALSGWGKAPGTYSNRSDERNAKVYGNLVAVHGNERNTVVYDAKTGARLMAFWGHAIAGNSQLGLIAATNRDQEVAIYDVATGKELMHVTVDNVVRAAQFVPAKKQLLVVTSNQRVYTLDISGTLSQPGIQTAAKAGQ
jgi:outer membrane protein assembly factor BamB